MNHAIPRQPRLPRAIGLTVLLLVAVSCGGDDNAATTTMPADTTSPPTTVPAATTAAPTAPPDTRTTTSAGATTTTPTDTDALAEGSGCTPGTDDLPDGVWYGFVDSTAADSLEFDLACWFTGDAAATAAAEDGEESPPPNDYYVRNANDLLRTVDVAAGAEASWLPNPGSPAEETIGYADWVTARADRPFQPGVWLTVEDGGVVLIEEQYVP